MIRKCDPESSFLFHFVHICHIWYKFLLTFWTCVSSTTLWALQDQRLCLILFVYSCLVPNIISLVYLCPAISRKNLICYLVFVGRTCFFQSSLFQWLAILHPVAQSKKCKSHPWFSSSFSLPSSSIINSCWFSFLYKSYTITSHHFAITTHPGLQEQLPSWSLSIFLCPWQFILYR